jgi:hypothetical protein
MYSFNYTLLPQVQSYLCTLEVMQQMQIHHQVMGAQ